MLEFWIRISLFRFEDESRQAGFKIQISEEVGACSCSRSRWWTSCFSFSVNSGVFKLVRLHFRLSFRNGSQHEQPRSLSQVCFIALLTLCWFSKCFGPKFVEPQPSLNQAPRLNFHYLAPSSEFKPILKLSFYSQIVAMSLNVSKQADRCALKAER